MIEWLDSSYPPDDAQVAAAKAAGYGGWAGYFAGTFILNGWSKADFDRVKAGGLRTLAYCSGWSDPAAMQAQSVAWGVPICLDVEALIRGDGPWVQGWLNTSGAGLYGNWGCHSGRTASFHVLAAYPTSGDPAGASWWGQTPRPPGLCGWQWAGTHVFDGKSVDSSWFDDGIGLQTFGPGGGTIGGTMFPMSARRAIVNVWWVSWFGRWPTEAEKTNLATNMAEDGSNWDILSSQFQGSPECAAWLAKLNGAGSSTDDDSAYALKTHTHAVTGTAT